MTSSEHLIGYVPVIDNGYLSILDRYSSKGASIGIFAADVSERYAPYLRKELRALTPERTAKILNASGIGAHVLDLTLTQQSLASANNHITFIDDDISRGVFDETHTINAKVNFESAFLRWDRRNVAAKQPVEFTNTISSTELDEVFADLYSEASKSSDWWRHVAAAVYSPKGEVIAMAHNQGLPHDFITSLEGDPRILASQGQDIDQSLFLHAEAGCIAHAAKSGTAIEGADLYVTTFPCPSCAKIVASSGIKSVLFSEGYAILDGQRVLERAGIDIIKVETNTSDAAHDQRLVPYPEKKPT